MQPGPARPALVIASALSTAAVLMLAPAAFASPLPGRLLPARPATAQGSRQLATARRTLAHLTAAPRTVIVRRGDTLSGLAAQVYGHAADWPVLFWANHHAIRWADDLMPGQRLRVVPLPRRVPAPPARTRPMPPAAPVAAPVPGSSTGTAAAVPPAPAPLEGGGGAPGGAFGDCVRARESGGNYGAYNPNGHYGAYQFSASTWAAYGGSPADYGHASPAEQDRVFANAIAAGGQGNWSPYDGCPAGLSTTAHRSRAARPGPAGPPVVHLLALMRQWVGHRGWHALVWAKSHARGRPYVWGGSGPGGYDCSGLVLAAYAHTAGITLPHNTDQMLGSGMLVPARHPRPGYLAFFGTEHVELYLGPGWTFGAHHTGTVVSARPYSRWYHPTAFYRLR